MFYKSNDSFQGQFKVKKTKSEIEVTPFPVKDQVIFKFYCQNKNCT